MTEQEQQEPREKTRLTGEETVTAQDKYIKRTYEEVRVSLEFPLSGWRRDECLLGAQLDKAISIIREEIEKSGLSDEEIAKAHNDWCLRKGAENRKIKWQNWLAQAQVKAILKRLE